MARIRPPVNGASGVRRRPKDRKAQIARASAEAFSALGYHGVSMEAIASRVGVSAAALYRHYSGKYELFRDAVLNLGRQLADATNFAEDEVVDTADDARVVLRRLVVAVTDIALANRESGGLYRWEARYLHADDQRALEVQLHTVHRRIQRALLVVRPELTSHECWTLSTSVLGVVGSIVDHRAKLPAGQIRAVLADIVEVVVTADLTELAAVPESEPAPVPAPVNVTKYEALLAESLRLFSQNGYHDTTMEDIAAAVGMPASGIYRYFSGKSDILAATFRRAVDRMSAEMADVLSTAENPEAALTALIDRYVARSFDHPEFEKVYFTERHNMTPSDQKIMQDLQRAAVESWVDVVTPLRPEWSVGQVRFAVHAAMALVIDLGRLLGYRNSVQARTVVTTLVDLTLLGRYRLRTALPAR